MQKYLTKQTMCTNKNNENYDYMTNDDRRLVQGCHKWVYRTKIRANIEI